MSLYRYQATLHNGALKEGSITAKTEAEAKNKVSAKHSVKEWIAFVTEKPATPPKSGLKPSTPAKPVKVPSEKVMGLRKLEKLLYLQSGRCFFCNEPLSLKDASIEHLQPQSQEGKNSDDNVAACCVALNQIFGNMDLKRKFEFVLKSAGKFKCPRKS